MSWWQRLRWLLSGDSWRIKKPLEGDGERAEDAPAEGGRAAESPADTVVLEVSDVLDLHCFAPRDVRNAVEAYLEEARAKGFSTVRIIHGKGAGVQRSQVRALLQRTPFVASFGDAPAEAGGWGATVVWFRDAPQETENRETSSGG